MVAAVATERDLAETFIQGGSQSWDIKNVAKRHRRTEGSQVLSWLAAEKAMPQREGCASDAPCWHWERHCEWQCEWDESDLGSHSRGPTLSFERCEQNG